MSPAAVSAPSKLLCCCVLSSALASTAAFAQTQVANAQLPSLKQLSIEELLEVEVTLPLRRESAVRDAPATISVVTSEDIRRSGAVTLPEVLRHIPGLFVTRFNGSSWIVTARGFASTSANKMLVMIDGRSIYSPLFSGVFWDQQDAMLLDLDRIEVIRGAGASLWGSNAVNGVINIVSKPAAETQGTLATVGGGAEQRFAASVRYGGRAGAGHFRVYGKYFDRDDAKLADGQDARDGQRFGQGGFRVDFGDSASGFTLQGDAYDTRVGFFDRDDIEARGINFLARWRRRWSSDSELQLQTYVDRTNRIVPDQFREMRQTFDVDLQHRFTASSRHHLSWGGAYRRSADDTEPTPLLFFDPEDRSTNLLSAFVQDDISWTRDLSTIFGIKFEHNDYTGVEYQPTARLRWTPDDGHTLWAALSRGIRMPTRLDTDVRVTVGGRVVITGNPDFESESVVATEFGYRGATRGMVAWDVVYFHNQYDDLRTQEVGLPVVVGNGLNVTIDGLTITGTVQPRSSLRLTGGYSYLTYDLVLDPTSTDLNRGRADNIDPAHQIFALARVDLARTVDFDVNARYVSELPNPGTPAYTEAGFRIGWRVTPKLELSLIGQDILHADHFEFISPTSSRSTRLERALFTRATVAF